MAEPRAGLWRAAVAASVAFGILIGLGVWQLRRLEWKTRILARIDAAERAPPVVLGAALPAPFEKISATGTLGPETAMYAAEVREPGGVPRMGGGLLEVLHRPGAAPVLVDLGWVADGARPVLGKAAVTGYARPAARRSWLSAADDPAAHHFYTLDPARIGAALGDPGLAAFTLVAMGAGVQGGPEPATALPRPPNDHLQYALTWFGLAGVLVGVFIGWARGRGRAS